MLRSFTFGFAQHTCELGVTMALGENRSRVNEHHDADCTFSKCHLSFVNGSWFVYHMYV